MPWDDTHPLNRYAIVDRAQCRKWRPPGEIIAMPCWSQASIVLVIASRSAGLNHRGDSGGRGDIRAVSKGKNASEAITSRTARGPALSTAILTESSG